MTVAADGRMLDRRRVELVDAGLPKIPQHVEAQGLPLDEGVVLVEHVRASAERHAKLRLDEVAAAVPCRITGIALRTCPELPPTIAERITNDKTRNVADWVIYRRALATAAEARGWTVYWYDAKNFADAHVEKPVGPPWTKDHRVAMAAAIAAPTV